jgi:hypothetical protein
MMRVTFARSCSLSLSFYFALVDWTLDLLPKYFRFLAISLPFGNSFAFLSLEALLDNKTEKHKKKSKIPRKLCC